MTRFAYPSVLRTLGVISGFALIGPPFGGLPFMGLLIFSGPDRTGPDVGDGGAVPAVLTGVVAGVLALRLRRRVWYLAATLTGLVMAVGFGLWMSGALSRPIERWR